MFIDPNLPNEIKIFRMETNAFIESEPDLTPIDKLKYLNERKKAEDAIWRSLGIQPTNPNFHVTIHNEVN